MSLEEEVRELRDEYLSRGLTEQKSERLIFAEMKAQEKPLAQVMRILRDLRFPTRTVVRSRVETPQVFFGCQQDEKGRVLDPFSLEEIPEQFLVSYIDRKTSKRFCFDLRQLVRQYVSEVPLQNPYTREKLPGALLMLVENYITKESRRIYVGPTRQEIFVLPYTTTYTLLVQILRLVGGNVLTAVTKVCPFLDGRSLYDFPLDAEPVVKPESVVEFYPFRDALEEAESLKKLFEYCNRNRREGGLQEAFFHALGYVLRVPPIFLDEGGQEYLLDPNLTVYETIKQIYRWLGGLEQIKRWKLVLENGIPLYRLKLKNLVSQQIPNLEIRYLYYNNDFEISKGLLFEVAFRADDEEMIRALSLYPQRLQDCETEQQIRKVLDDRNLTLQDLIEFVIDRVCSARGTVSQTGNGSKRNLLFDIVDHLRLWLTRARKEQQQRFLRSCILSCDTPEKMQRLRVFVENLNPEEIVYLKKRNFFNFSRLSTGLSYREIPNQVLLEFFYGVPGKYSSIYNEDIGSYVAHRIESVSDLADTLQSDILPLKNDPADFYTALLVNLDDVEWFYNHYKTYPWLLRRFLLSYGAPQSIAYIIQNEPARSLYNKFPSGPVFAHLRKQLIARLSTEEIKDIIWRGDVDFEGMEELLESVNFPREIINDAEFYNNSDVMTALASQEEFREAYAMLKKSVWNKGGATINQSLLWILVPKINPENLKRLLEKSNSIVFYKELYRYYVSLPISTTGASQRPTWLKLRPTSEVVDYILRNDDFDLFMEMEEQAIQTEDVLKGLCRTFSEGWTPKVNFLTFLLPPLHPDKEQMLKLLKCANKDYEAGIFASLLLTDYSKGLVLSYIKNYYSGREGLEDVVDHLKEFLSVAKKEQKFFEEQKIKDLIWSLQ